VLSSWVFLLNYAKATDLQYIITLNESGTYTTDPKTGKPTQSPGYYQSGTFTTYLVYTLAPDPALANDFPAVPRFSAFDNAAEFTEKVTTGDVFINGAEGESDYLRFENIQGLPGDKTGGSNAIFFYSDADPKSATDVGLPPPVSEVMLNEDAPNNVPPGYQAQPSGTIVYVPDPGQPGGLSTDKTGGRYEYIIVSDCSSDETCGLPTPEPSTSVLCGPFLLTFLVILSHRKRQLMSHRGCR
jgi:hypothetical protein